jgi:hypothetical protein
VTADSTPESLPVYIPTIEQIRTGWINSGNQASAPRLHAASAFDRWLTAHDAEIERKALQDAAEAWVHSAWSDVPRIKDQVQERLSTANYVGDWLRARAEQIGEK